MKKPIIFSLVFALAAIGAGALISQARACDFGCGDYGYSSYGYDSYDPCGYGCGGYGGGYSSYDPCGSGCGGFGFGYGGYGGYSSGSYYAPTKIKVTNKYNFNYVITSPPPPPITPPPVYVPPPVYTPPPVYISPPVYNPPPIYIPPVYTPPPVYYPPPIYNPPSIIPPPPIVCSVTFANFNPPLVAVEGRVYDHQLQAVSTISGFISYRLVSGPDGLIVNPNGLMSWTPAFNQGRVQAYAVTVAAYNGGCETSQTFSITVLDINPVPPPPPAPAPKPPVTCFPVCPTACPVAAPAQPQYPQQQVAGGSFSGGAMASAVTGFWGGITAILGSPFTLFIVIVILVFLLVRANRRVREMRVAV